MSEPAGPETLDVRTRDGWSLRADVHEPTRTLVGVAVLAHAAMARRTTFDRPEGAGAVQLLVDHGWRVIAFDFRGHGDSGPRGGQRGSWGYDELVLHDAPSVFAFAESRAVAGRPIAAVGHSLGGHVFLAAQGTGRTAFDSIVAVGASPWLRELESSTVRWLAKRAALRAALAVCRRAGRFPARAMRLGSDDESRAFFQDFEGFSREGWRSRDRLEDYAASLANVRCPVLQIVSRGDRLLCAPDCGARFVALCGGPNAVHCVEEADGGGPPPTHMGLVTGPGVRDVWQRIERWLRGER